MPGVRDVSTLLCCSWMSDHSTKHLAGHQFVIGRIVTGVYLIFRGIERKRIPTGFGNGLNTATVPSWQAECSKPKNRGLHICIEASMIAIGTVTAYWIVSCFCRGSCVTLNVGHRVSRTLVSRSSIAPSPGDSLLVSRSSSQSCSH